MRLMARNRSRRLGGRRKQSRGWLAFHKKNPLHLVSREWLQFPAHSQRDLRSVDRDNITVDRSPIAQLYRVGAESSQFVTDTSARSVVRPDHNRVVPGPISFFGELEIVLSDCELNHDRSRSSITTIQLHLRPGGNRINS